MIRQILVALLAAEPAAIRVTEVECPATSSPPAPDRVSSDGCIGKLGWFPLSLLSIASGTDLASLEGQLGSPEREWSGPDRFKGDSTVVYREFKQLGVRVLTSQPEGSGDVWLEEFEISARGPELPCGLELGQDQERVLKVLGLAARKGTLDEGQRAIVTGWNRFWCGELNGEIIYFASHSGIHLFLDDGSRLSKVLWKYTAD